MFKTTIAAAAAAIAFAPAAALAGPYVNVETNAGWTGGRLHRGNHRSPCGLRRMKLGESASYYVQVGASVVSPDGAEIRYRRLSGKAGHRRCSVSDALGVIR